MRTVTTLCSAVVLLAVGYLAGASGVLRPGFLYAQDAKEPAKEPAKEKPAAPGTAAPNQLSDDTKGKIKAAADALKVAMEALQLDQRYNPATKGMNVFSILSGRCNAADELKAGQGVDPETFVALYLGLGTDEVQSKIGHDAEGRIVYEGKLVRLLPKPILHQMYVSRAAITGEDLPITPAVKPGTEKKPAATKKPDAEPKKPEADKKKPEAEPKSE